MTNLEALEKTVRTLRSPGGCPWDREQTHQSLTEHLIDECSELLDTIDRGDMEHMREELGDVLLQVVMHAEIARESGHFDLDAVAGEINEKLIRRHPHVFGDEETRKHWDTADKVLVKWDEIKAREKRDKGRKEEGLFKELPPGQPSLLYALALYKQVRKKKIPLNGHVDEKAVEEKAEGLTEERLGYELFQWVAAARRAKMDPEGALRRFTTTLREKLGHENEGEAT